MRERQVTSKTILRAESPRLEVANCHLIFITEHLVKVKEWRGYEQVASEMQMNHLEKRHKHSLSQQQDI